MAIPESLQIGLRLPVVAAPMFLTSGPDLVTSCCEAGVIGTFPALNQRSTAGFADWLTAIEGRLQRCREHTGRVPAAYGVNLVVHRTNPRLEADLEVCVMHRVPLIITSLGASSDLVARVHRYGGQVFHDVTTLRHARKAAEAGVDGLIAVAAGAGGHSGAMSPFAIVNELRQFFTGTLLLAGSLSTGRDVAAAQLLGADLAYLGTRFIATRESLVPDEYKAMILHSTAADIVYTPAISGVPANFLRPSLMAAGLDPDHLVAPEQVDFGTELSTREDRSKPAAWRDLWSAGQGVGSIGDLPAAGELIEQLREDYVAAIAELSLTARRHAAAGTGA